MLESKQDRGLTTPRRGGGMGPAVAYYRIVGGFGAALGAWFVLSLVREMGDGCPPGGAVCGHSLLELIPPFVASVVGLTLLPTARRLRADPPRLGPLVGIGAVGGVAVAVLPIVLIVWAAAGSGEFNIFGSKVSTVGLVVLFVPPLLWALWSAVIVARYAHRRGQLRVLAMAGGAAALIAVLGSQLAGMVGGQSGGQSGPAEISSAGTMTVRLEGPVQVSDSGEAGCTDDGSGEQWFVAREDPEASYGRFSGVYVTVTAGEAFAASEREPRDDALALEIMLGNAYADEERDRGVDLVSTRDSVIEGRWGPASGELRFAKLSELRYGGGPPVLTTEWEGTIEWTCPMD